MIIYICDDVAEDRASIREHVHTYCHANMIEYVIEECASAEELLRHANTHQREPSVYFLDIYMNKLTGMDAAKQLYSRAANGDSSDTSIIFVTTSQDYAIESYKVEADGYIMKPFSYGEIEFTLNRAQTKFSKIYKCIEFTSGRLTYKVNLKDIVLIETGNHCCIIHTVNRDYKAARQINNLEEELSSEACFLRCHRSFIVNLNHVQSVEHDRIIMKNKQIALITVRNSLKLRQRIADFCFMQLGDD